MRFNEIKDKLFEAANQVKVKDSHLLLHDINEPAISHRLAMYLTPKFTDFDVDCEYNGNIDAESGRKYINLLITEARALGLINVDAPPVDNGPDEQIINRPVYPDIIVHKRGHNGKENNLLIIEVKKSSSRVNGQWDALKLSRFTSKEYENDFDYCFGAFVRFDVGNRQPDFNVVWYKDGQKYNDRNTA
ncbi:MAG: hypothetical protein ABIL62_13080 [Planctomycetota bacterium]